MGGSVSAGIHSVTLVSQPDQGSRVDLFDGSLMTDHINRETLNIKLWSRGRGLDEEGIPAACIPARS